MGPHAALVALDLVLALGACLRLTRFVVADDVPGNWWIKAPLYGYLSRRYPARTVLTGRTNPLNGQPVTNQQNRKWLAYFEGLSCPYCFSVWMAAFVTVTLLVAGGAGDAADWWRYVAGFLTLAWLTGHIAARAGDTED